jgi:integrase
VRLVRAIDLYIGDLARRGRSKVTRDGYERLLFDFADLLPRDVLVSEITLEDYEQFLDRWTNQSRSTLASSVSLVRGFSRFLYKRGYTPTDVAAPLERPSKQRPEDLDVITVSKHEVERMLRACETIQELLCITTAIYLGARRKALAGARWGDVDLETGMIRFKEKGGKISHKPLPLEYADMLAELDRGNYWSSPGDYLIPNRRPASVRRAERSDKVIWNTVKLVAKRAGVRSHVHALRAAFAVQFDDQHPDQLYALKELMGHVRLETTATYLRRKDREKAMSLNRDLKWGAYVFESQTRKSLLMREKAHTGFEPVFRETAEPPQENENPPPLKAKLDELIAKERKRARRH